MKKDNISKEDKVLEINRHSLAHIMAFALKRMYKNVSYGIGPSNEVGFYYDVLTKKPVSEEDLGLIENEMKKIINEELPFSKKELKISDAIKLFKELKQDFKVELLNDLKDYGTTDQNEILLIKDKKQKKGEKVSLVSIYILGKIKKDISLKDLIKNEDIFIDLCRGPHIKNTKEINLESFKISRVAGAYWRGSEKNKMLTRVYGIAFNDKYDLEEYLKLMEEAEKRDHRKLGKELDLFSIDDYVGPGLVLWHPKLSLVREEIELYWRMEHRKRGYQYIYTPHVGLDNLWATSGHLETFKDGMYPGMAMETKDKNEKAIYYVKPMSCPFHVRVYKSRLHSYQELPIRYCELGSVYRYEDSGVLHGMLRVRGFTQDDAHIICAEEQFVEEINRILDFALDINKSFGFDKLNVYLSVRDQKNKDKYIGEKRVWNLAENTLEEVLKSRDILYKKDVGGAKFYGPAIDLKAVDAMGREWQGTTIQLDMNLPTRFGMKYIGSDGKEHTPIMLHRTLLGSMERFVGTLIEQYAGAFPLWLAPTQVMIIPISEKNIEYANLVRNALAVKNIRVEVNQDNETLGKKIRIAEMQKIPYIVVVGLKEEEHKIISVRERKVGDIGNFSVNDFVTRLEEEIKEKIIKEN